jgi:hypothetical protein
MSCGKGDMPEAPKLPTAGENYGSFIRGYGMFSGQRDKLAREELGRAERYGDRARRAAESEEDYAIRMMLAEQIGDELSYGATLDPSLRREVQQAVRSGQTARGMGRGVSDLADEIYAVGTRSDDLRRRRQGMAMTWLQNQSMTAPNAMGMLSGITGSFGNLAMGAMGMENQNRIVNLQNQHNAAMMKFQAGQQQNAAIANTLAPYSNAGNAAMNNY